MLKLCSRYREIIVQSYGITANKGERFFMPAIGINSGSVLSTGRLAMLRLGFLSSTASLTAMTLLFTLLVFSGCTPKTHSYNSRSATSNAPATFTAATKGNGALFSDLGKPKLLLGVNSIFLPTLKLSPELRQHEGMLNALDSELQIAVANELQLRVLHQHALSSQKSASLEQELQKIASGSPYDTQALLKNKNSALVKLLAKERIDGVLLVTLLRYTEREGSGLGVSRPAEVGFRMSLVSTDNGAPVIWDSSFHFKDEALMDNLLKARGRFSDGKSAGWKRADTMLQVGFGQALGELAAQRDQQFLVADTAG